MSNKSYRIRTEAYSGDQQIKLKLDQHYDHLNILSLTLKPADTWANRCSDFGVVIGRVSANKGFGVPNAKVSIFIPLTAEDEYNPEIVARYPFKQTSDKRDGVRYNLFPSIKQSPTHTPIGTFPTKEEILRDDLWLEIYQKYYKFTTRTNEAGDFMFYGVPTGTYIIHYDVDISDIDDLSVVPFELIAQGKAEQLFDGPYKFKYSKDIDSLPQIITIDKTISVQPFWGSTDLCDVQITRSDFDLSDKGVELKSYALFMGSSVTDSDKNLINQRCKVKKKVGEQDQLQTMPGKIEILTVVDSDGDNVPDSVEFLNVSTAKIDENGVWAFLVELNGQRVMKDEFGNEIVSPSATQGVVKNGFFRFKFSIGADADESVRYRAKYIVPNNGVHEYAYLFNRSDAEWIDSNGDPQAVPGFNTIGDDGFSIDGDGYYSSGPLFREFNRKKVYTVRNYIPRYLKVEAFTNKFETPKYLGFKDVDKNKAKAPIPYNRMDPTPGIMYTVMCLIYSALFFIVMALNNILSVINTIIHGINWFIEQILNAICSIFNALQHALDQITCPDINIDLGEVLGTVHIPLWCFHVNVTPGFCSHISDYLLPYIAYVSFSCCSNCDGETGCNCYIPFYDCYNQDSICDGSANIGGVKKLRRCDTTHTNNGKCTEHCNTQQTSGNPSSEIQQHCHDNAGACGNFTQLIGDPGYEESVYSFCTDSLKQCMLAQYVCNNNELRLDFYNAWISGLLYFTQIRYKERVNTSGVLKKSKFCDADWNSPHTVIHPFKNDQYNTHITERALFSSEDDYSDGDLYAPAGIIKYWPRLPQPPLGDVSTSDYIKGPFDDVYYNARQMRRPFGYNTAPTGTDNTMGNIFLATEIMALGSYLVVDDPDNAPFFINQVPETTYKLSEDLSDFYCFSCEKIVPNNGPYGVSLHQKICEFGTDFNDEGDLIYGTGDAYALYIDGSFLSGRTYMLYGNTVYNFTDQPVALRYGHQPLNGDVNTNYYLLGQENLAPAPQIDPDNIYVNQWVNGYVTKFFNTYHNNTYSPVVTPDIYDRYVRYEANPYYMYYGLHPGKTAIDLVHNNFIPKNICNI